MGPDHAICPRCAERTTRFDACEHCEGQVMLRDRYLLVEEVGHGARGTVYRALDRSSGEAVAIKEIPFRKMDELKILELADREIKLLRQLDHPSVPRHIDDFVDGPTKHRSLYLVQEFVEGRSLADEMAQRRYSERDVLGVIVGVLEALQYLHRLSPPVIHRDIKPGNIIRRPDGRLALVDFGSARDTFKAVSEGSTVAGTFGYMAPEQFHGDAFVATDIYGLGAVAVALLSRRDPAELLDYQRGLDWRAAVNVTPATRALLERMLAPDPRYRPADAGALRAEVAALVHGHVHRPAPPQPRPAARPRVRTLDPFAEIDQALTSLFSFQSSSPPRPSPPPQAHPVAPAYAMAVRPPAPIARPSNGSWMVGPALILGILFLLGLLF